MFQHLLQEKFKTSGDVSEFIHSLIANCKWVPMDNLQYFNAQDGIYLGPADFFVLVVCQ